MSGLLPALSLHLRPRQKQEPAGDHEAQFDPRKRIATDLALQHDSVRSSHPQKKDAVPESFTNVRDTKTVSLLEDAENVYRNGLRGCHFGGVTVNLWKTSEVS